MARTRTALLLFLLVSGRGSEARWVPAAQPVETDLNAVCLLPDGHAWAVGDGGGAVHSPDNGETWAPQAMPIVNRLTSVSFASPLVGWASGEGGDVAATSDGGEVWRKVIVVTDDLGLGPPDTIDPIVATGEMTAWALARWGDATFLYRTADGGSTWNTVRYTDRGYNSPGTVFGMAFSTDSDGWLLAERITGPPQAYIPVFLHTTNGGASWQELDAYATPLTHPSTPDWKTSMGVAAATNFLAHVWDPIHGTGSVFHVVEDSHGLWRQVTTPLDVPLGSVSFPDAANAWLVGAATFQSIDYAHTFRQAENPDGLPLTASFAGARGVAAGPGGHVFQWVEDSPGDVNGDGLADIRDAVLAAGMLAGKDPRDALSLRLADADPAPAGDGALTAGDVAAILQMLSGVGSRQ